MITIRSTSRPIPLRCFETWGDIMSHAYGTKAGPMTFAKLNRRGSVGAFFTSKAPNA